MTKSRNHKATVRAYMTAHGVNYTSAARALAASTATSSTPAPVATPARNPDPDPWNLAYALAALAADEAVMAEHASDPESPVTADLLRVAVHAAGTHGPHVGGPRWFPDAIEVCRSAVLAVEVTVNFDDPHDVDGQCPVDPADLAGVLRMLADDDLSLGEHATEHGLDAEDLAEVLYWLAAGLEQPHDPYAHLAPERRAWLAAHGSAFHVLVVGAQPVTPAEMADFDDEDLADLRTSPDRDYSITCPGIRQGRCEGWEECQQCYFLSSEAREELDETGVLHGVEHQYMSFGLATATGRCSLQEFPDAWVDSPGDLDLPPGRYAIDFDWDEGCELSLVTANREPRPHP